MALIRAQVAFLVASCLVSQAIGLPKNMASSMTATESATHSIVTDHVTQTHHTLVTDTLCANLPKSPSPELKSTSISTDLSARMRVVLTLPWQTSAPLPQPRRLLGL